MKVTLGGPEGSRPDSQGLPADKHGADRSDTWGLLDRSPVPVVLFDKDRIAEANAAAAELFGWSRETLLGKAVDSISSYRQPDGRAASAGFRDRLGKALEGQEPQSFHGGAQDVGSSI